MAAHYINSMVDLLAEFDNYKHTFDYYEAFAWMGSLQETMSYIQLSNTKKDSMSTQYYQEKLYGDKLCTN